jgi:hypothetical protein
MRTIERSLCDKTQRNAAVTEERVVMKAGLCDDDKDGQHRCHLAVLGTKTVPMRYSTGRLLIPQVARSTLEGFRAGAWLAGRKSGKVARAAAGRHSEPPTPMHDRQLDHGICGRDWLRVYTPNGARPIRANDRYRGSRWRVRGKVQTSS